MIDEARGRIDYDERGTGPTIVLVPGSCSTGAAWRPVMAAWNDKFRCVTTSLLGYGGTAERRTPLDASIDLDAEIVEAVIRKAGGRVHLVGHSAGALISLCVALRDHVPLASLTLIEPPTATLLRENSEPALFDVFRQMTDAYIAAFEGGNPLAIESMIDFYGGPGTFASWPPKLRAYAVATTPANILDWKGCYGFVPAATSLASLTIPVLVIRGGASCEAMQRANALINEHIKGSELATIDGAGHFVIATHPDQIARLVELHVHRAEG
jgi:pimeloyl-ACP methyl ester carboxylesterase